MLGIEPPSRMYSGLVRVVGWSLELVGVDVSDEEGRDSEDCASVFEVAGMDLRFAAVGDAGMSDGGGS